MDIYNEIAEKIIEQQESIIGPVAIEQASQLHELNVDWPNHKVVITGDGQQAINKLVGQYKALFGQISVEVCKEAVARLVSQLPADQLPESLR
jgi:hypothetical protein